MFVQMSQSDTHGKLLHFHTGYINFRLCGIFTLRISMRSVICIKLLPLGVPTLLRTTVSHFIYIVNLNSAGPSSRAV